MACGNSHRLENEKINKLSEKDVDIDQILNDLLGMRDLQPKSYPLEFDLESVREIFEFLLQITTLLFKHFHGDEKGQVNLELLGENDLKNINAYIMALGFVCNFQLLPANAYNLEYAMRNRYDKITITNATNIKDLMLGLKCNQKLFIINFDII